MNRVLKKVEMTENRISYGYVGKKEDLKIVELVLRGSRLVRKQLEELFCS